MIHTTETGDYGNAFPASRRVHVDGPMGIRVPMREIHLSGGKPPLRVYDTAGPREVDVRHGLPRLREGWIRSRGNVTEVGRHELPALAKNRRHGDAEMPAELSHVVLKGSSPVTQMHYARQGEVTPEMEFVALREEMDPDFVRSEIARGRAILPANRNHPEPRPMIIGRGFKVKINANIGNSSVTSSIEEEVEKLRWATRSWTCPRARTSIRLGSGSSGTRPSRSGRYRSIRRWKRSVARPRISPGRSTGTR